MIDDEGTLGGGLLLGDEVAQALEDVAAAVRDLEDEDEDDGRAPRG